MQLAVSNLAVSTSNIGNNGHERAAAGARLLVMGAERVGKSAAIVRFTTGRFIHQYCPSTQDWLYRHQLSATQQQQSRDDLETNDENAPPVLIELLEQRDLPSESGDQQRSNQTTVTKPNCSSSLALRVASDQRADRELRECQQLIGKLNWANAYVIVYSLTSLDSFNRARDYLELLDWLYGNTLETCGQPDQARHPSFIKSMISQRLASQPVKFKANHCRPPILLLGNKHDLVSSNLQPASRQVTLEQAHQLAVQHQCLFAEVSISECANSIRNVLLELIGRINLPATQPQPSSRTTFEQHSASLGLTQPVVTKWSQPSHQQQRQQQQQQQAWGSLIKTQMPLVSSSHSTQVVGLIQETHQHQQQRPVAATCKPLDLMTSTSSSHAAPRRSAAAQFAVAPRPLSTASLSNPPPPTAKQSSPTNASRYGALRSTFKKASLAIVSGKALASRVSGRNSTGDAPPASSVTALKRNSTTSSNLSELVAEQSSSFSVRGSLGSLSSNATTTAALPPSEAGPPSAAAASGKPSSKSSNWIRNRFSRQESVDSGDKSSHSAGASNSGEIQLPREQVASGGGGGRFKRPLFKYKNRLKTVAFEPGFGSANKTAELAKQSSESIQTVTTGSLDGASSSGKLQYRERPQRVSETTSPLSSNSSSSGQPPPSGTYNLNRCNSGRSSSSLSTSDTYYSSLFIVCQAGDQDRTADRSPASVSSHSSSRHAPTPPSERSQRQDSRSTLSRASTSVGSYDEMLEEMESATGDECGGGAVPPTRPPVATPLVGKISPDKPPAVCAPLASMKARFQVVKTVQSTLTNLAKSTRASVTPLQPVKRSFCSALMGTSLGLASPRVCQATGAPNQQLAQIEPIRTIPAVIGYCK